MLSCYICGANGQGTSTLWQINGSSYSLNNLFAGAMAGSGRNIVVEDYMMNDVRNGSQYQCEIDHAPPDPDIEGIVTILYVAGECNHFLVLYI